MPVPALDLTGLTPAAALSALRDAVDRGDLTLSRAIALGRDHGVDEAALRRHARRGTAGFAPYGSASGRTTVHTGRADVVSLRSGPVAGVDASRGAPQLPPEVEIGVNTIHRYDDPRVTPSHIAVTVFTPLPTADAPGSLRDTNAKPLGERLPKRFIIGDSGTTRAFVGVDTRDGTPLAQRLDDIIAQIPKAGATPTLDEAVSWLKTNVNRLIKWTAGSSANDGRAEFAWDKAIRLDDSIWDTFRAAGSQQVGDPPASSGQSFPVVPFERWLEAGQGYCIQKALLAALVLDRLGLPFRLINGAVGMGPGRTTGHSWIELPNDAIFDPAWGSVTNGPSRHDDFPDRYRVGGSYRFANQTYPYLALD